MRPIKPTTQKVLACLEFALDSRERRADYVRMYERLLQEKVRDISLKLRQLDRSLMAIINDQNDVDDIILEIKNRLHNTLT